MQADTVPTDIFKNFPQPEWWGLGCATTRQSREELKTALLWVITQWIVLTAYQRFGATYRSHSQGPLTTTRCVITQGNAGFIYFAAEAWNHAREELKTGAVTTGRWSVAAQNCSSTFSLRNQVHHLDTASFEAAVWCSQACDTFTQQDFAVDS